MTRSTARFISYDLRPAKQCERTILLDLLRLVSDAGFSIKDYRYVGMGANRFYDFLLMYRYLGVRNMISIEHDPIMFERAKFNCPYHFIDVRNTTTAEFLSLDDFEEPTIVWFDYDGGISAKIVEDITALGTQLKVGDLCLVTVYGGLPGLLNRKSAADRLEWLTDEFEDIGREVTMEDVENYTFFRSVHKILRAAFQFAFAARPEGVFQVLISAKYSDGAPMITVGGGFFAEGTANDIGRRIKKDMPFLVTDDNFFEIRAPNLTDKERALFDLVATKQNRRRCANRNQLEVMGFRNDDIAVYKELLRYLPRYFESIV